MQVKKVTVLCLAVALAIGGISGCAKKKNAEAGEKVKLTYWCELPGAATNIVTDLSETELYKELEKRTGVEIEFMHPPAGQSGEQFNIMVASRNLPDMIEKDWSQYPGAERKAAQDKVLIDFTDYIDEYAPNFKNYINTQTPKAKKWVTTEDRYYIFPSLASYDNFVSITGPIMRKDLLDKFGLSVPTTIDEWENVLRTFKANGIKYPLSYLDIYTKWWYPFMGSYGVARTFIQHDGVMKYGYMEEGMKDYLAKMRSWLEEGLLDPDIITMDGKAFDGKVLNGEVGAWVGSIADIKTKETELKKTFPEAEVIGVPYPSLVKGEPCKVIHIDRRDGYTFAGAVGITATNKHPEETVKWLDYAFSEEGHMLYNFGIEGKSYEMVDGYPKYTDLILNNPNGLSLDEALINFTRPTSAGYVDERYMEQYYDMPAQREAAAMWSENALLQEHVPTWKACYKMTVEESKELSDITINFDNFVNEKYTKYLMGVESLDTFDDYVKQLKDMGVDRALKIYQTAYDRVMK